MAIWENVYYEKTGLEIGDRCSENGVETETKSCYTSRDGNGNLVSVLVSLVHCTRVDHII